MWDDDECEKDENDGAEWEGEGADYVAWRKLM